jgi:predicted nucleotidyltransferase
MSKILAIISEYNPFHNGHLYHLQKSKKMIDPDYSICIMSGNFCQRGDTSIMDKWSKTDAALKCGFDLVVELPVVYSISSAENFAEGALKILEAFDDVTLSFGSECGNLEILNNIANVLYNEPKEYQTILAHELSKGLSYPKARENALLLYLNNVRKYANVLSNPNNILGIEYLKAIKKLKSKVVPFTIKRIDEGYNSLKVKDRLASATAIRNLVKNNENVKKLMPTPSFNILLENINNGKILNDISVFEKEIIYTLRKMSLSEIAELQDVTEGLENAIKQAANTCNNLEDLINSIKSKRYTRSRIQRILLYALLNITKKDIKNSYRTKPYVRILGASKRGKYLLSRLNNPKYPVITSVKKFMDNNNNKILKSMIEKDILASNIYTLGYKNDSKANLDYTKKLIIT